MGRILVVTPTYDERDNLPRFVRALFEALPEADLLVVDDDSPDGTGVMADALAAEDTRIRVLHRHGKRGLGSAYAEAFERAMALGYDVVIQMDSDLSHDPRHLPAFCRAIDEGADLVLGSRAVPGGGVVGWGLGRRLLSTGGSWYARRVLGLGVRDLTTGFKALTRRALDVLLTPRLRCNGYAFQIETTYRALRAGLPVIEIPITFVDRRVGQSKLDRWVFAEAVVAPWLLRAGLLG
ncbi:MAG: polyprenol monophosphomannose synthase [Myxococcales bacterium]|nr:polyprenol monophosphomannose synthase [Myxococcales bacterium]